MKGKQYAQTVGLVVIAILIAFAVYHGWHRNDTLQTQQEPSPYTDVSTWHTENDTRGFSLSYPVDFEANEIHNVASVDWRINADGNPGMPLFTLTIPKVFEPQTNFSDAKLTVGMSSQTKAVQGCLTPDPSGGTIGVAGTVSIQGTTFHIFTFSDAGAGNIYDTTSYRTVHNGACWAVEYTIHSTQLANYPAELHLSQFNEVRVKQVLDRVVGTVVLK